MAEEYKVISKIENLDTIKHYSDDYFIMYGKEKTITKKSRFVQLCYYSLEELNRLIEEGMFLLEKSEFYPGKKINNYTLVKPIETWEELGRCIDKGEKIFNECTDILEYQNFKCQPIWGMNVFITKKQLWKIK